MANLCKYYKQVRQVSYDSGVTWVNLGEVQKGDLYEYNSPSCGGVTEYRWVDVTGAYTCVGTTKYQKTKKQESTDGGSTWQDVSPAEYGTGAVIEYASTDCGYVPPTPAGCNDYLTFVAEEAGTFKFSGTTGNDSISYSFDSGTTWYTLARNTDSPTVSAGNKIMWKGTMTPTDASGNVGIGRFSSTGRFQVEGNAMSLLFGDNFTNQTSLVGKNCAFRHLFNGCTKLTSAENLCLPATTLSKECYANMFYNCTSLTTAPVLPATTLARYCYGQMFHYCTSLATAPQLPATTLAEECYYAMFASCSNITTAPQLPATTLTYWCYGHMFSRCSSLRTAPVLLAEALAEKCYYGMFEYCTSLTIAPALPATTLTKDCYRFMFQRCTSLTTAPVLSAASLTDGCYYSMFYGCSNLNYIKCLATSICSSPSDYEVGCTYTWVSGVSANGTFVKNSSMSGWPSGTSGIPTNWTVQNA